MRKTSVRELYIHTSELVREAAEGGIISDQRSITDAGREESADLQSYAKGMGSHASSPREYKDD